FIGQLDEPIQLLAALCAHTEEWFITEFKNADELLDAKDNVIDPIKQFLNGSQRDIYDEAARFTQRNQSNIVHLPTGAIDVVVQLLDDPKIFRGAKVNELGTAISELESELATLVNQSRADAVVEIQKRWELIPANAAFRNAPQPAQDSVTRRVESVIGRIENETQIPVIQSIAATFAGTTYPEILDTLAAAAAETEAEARPVNEEFPAEPPKQTVALNRLHLPGVGEVLETVDDVDRYLDELRQTLLNTINDNKRITL